MSVSVIIPSHNEEKYLNRTIQNIFLTATGEIEVIVVLQPEWHEVDPRARVIRLSENVGERVAMNAAVAIANHTHILRIDAHCDFSPYGWDQLMEEVTGEKDMTQAVLTAVDKSWKRIPGHRYERCRLLSNMEAKWEKPNKDASLSKVIPNMSSTGCGWMMRKDFYLDIGGADESFPPMGAIGEEFSVKTWMNLGKVQTRTDVIIGHIFAEPGDPVGYDTGGVLEARQRLVKEFGDRYGEIRDRFPDVDWGQDVRPAAVQSEETRDSVTVRREDVTTFKNADGTVAGQKIKRFAYLWVAEDHPNEKHWSNERIQEEYSSQAQVIESEQTLVANEDGVLFDQATGEVAYKGNPPEHYGVPSEDSESRQALDKGE
jgi:hypothetical protein